MTYEVIVPPTADEVFSLAFHAIANNRPYRLTLQDENGQTVDISGRINSIESGTGIIKGRVGSINDKLPEANQELFVVYAEPYNDERAEAIISSL